MQILSQRDPRWADQKLGFSVNTTIGQLGCTISCIAMKFNTTPDVVNQRLKAVNGFLDANLVIWKKLEEALPGVVFGTKYDTYDNNLVLQNLPCIVEVDATPIGAKRHWVLFIGNHRLYDPWDGQEKPTSTYQPLSFVTLSGNYNQASTPATPPLSAADLSSFQQELDGVIKAADLIKNWAMRWQNALSSASQTQPKTTESGINWLTKLLQSGFGRG